MKDTSLIKVTDNLKRNVKIFLARFKQESFVSLTQELKDSGYLIEVSHYDIPDIVGLTQQPCIILTCKDRVRVKRQQVIEVKKIIERYNDASLPYRIRVFASELIIGIAYPENIHALIDEGKI